MPPDDDFVDLGEFVVLRREIRTLDLSRLEELYVTVHVEGKEPVVLRDHVAVDVLMRLCPKVFEGRRLRYVRHAWAVHNLIGHPLLQVCAWLGMTKLGLRIHDATTPRPRGVR